MAESYAVLLRDVAFHLSEDADRLADLPYAGLDHVRVAAPIRANAAQLRALADLLERVTPGRVEELSLDIAGTGQPDAGTLECERVLQRIAAGPARAEVGHG